MAAQTIGIQEGIPIYEDVAEARGNPHEIEALANTGLMAVQHGALRGTKCRRAGTGIFASEGYLATRAGCL